MKYCRFSQNRISGRTKKLVLLLVFFVCFSLSLFAAEHDRDIPRALDMGHQMTILVLQVALVIIVSRLFGFLFQKYLKQPRVLGELVAGMVIGPYALGKISLDVLHGPLFPITNTTMPVSPELYGLAVVASIILLFISGLETDLPTFLRFSGIGSVIGLGGVIVAFTFGDLVAVLFFPGINSFMDPAALFLGTLSTATSVGITARILSEKRKMSSPEGVTILAAAVFDDVVGIILLAVVVGIARSMGSDSALNWGGIGIIAAKAFGFWIACTVIGILVAPKLTKGLKWFHSMDMITSISFGLALFLAGLSEMAGLAMIIGAYVMGLSLSQTDIAHEIREKLSGLYEFFVPIFFCVMGMMVNFWALKGVLLFGLIYTAAAVLGKLVGCGLPALLTRFNLKGAFRIGAGMLPRGEVTLIVAGIGLGSGAIGQDLFGVAIMTLLIASVAAPPLLIKSFSGGPGLRSNLKLGGEEKQPVQLALNLSTRQAADFVRGRILRAFRSEEFFTNRVDFDRQIYHIRKDEILLTFYQEDGKIIINTDPKNEQFVRLLLLEEILELKDLLEGLQKMKDPGTMGEDLLQGLFDSDE
jgi:Kef-type K+ transport system membrane component KefB